MTTTAPCSRDLPPEIWSLVLKNVPRLQMRNLLGVCSLFHDILIPILFASIKVYFLHGDRALEVLNADNMDEIEGKNAELMCMSCGLLNYICQNPLLAKVVKRITVIAFTDGPGLVEIFTVANVLSFMPNLETFRWIGDRPEFDEHVAENLPKTLKHLVFQSPNFPFSALEHILQLKTLHLSIPFFYPDGDEAVDGAVEDENMWSMFHSPIERIFQTFPSTLQSLRLEASHVARVPVQAFSTLRELEVFGTVFSEEELVGLDVMFQHATSLESLTLAGFLNHLVFSFLPDYASTGALPKLTSFRLCTENEGFLRGVKFYALQKFLEGRHILRRLFIRIPDVAFLDVVDLFPVIKGLKGLEILGLHTGRDCFSDQETLTRLVESLSPNLRALHLATSFEKVVLEQSLIESIAELPHLSFLSLSLKSEYDIDGQYLAQKFKGLEMVAYDRHVWNITRVGSDIHTTKWPSWRVKFCVEEDFPCADDAWLFKYN